MTYEDLIKQWYARSQREPEIFTKFIFLYIAFTAFMTQHYNPDYSHNDREMIEAIKSDHGLRALYTRLQQKDHGLPGKIETIISELDEQPLINVTRPNGDRRWDGRIHGTNDWPGIVEFWYCVRNNLFHGHKTLELERDVKLVTAVYSTINPLMEHFIQNRLTWAV